MLLQVMCQVQRKMKFRCPDLGSICMKVLTQVPQNQLLELCRIDSTVLSIHQGVYDIKESKQAIDLWCTKPTWGNHVQKEFAQYEGC